MPVQLKTLKFQDSFRFLEEDDQGIYTVKQEVNEQGWVYVHSANGTGIDCDGDEEVEVVN